ncbi:MAG: HIT family protein [Gammaproteobacteria bacterium]|nr:HIT family protein [Gammaproteobacteria bacterium]
MTDCVFCKIIAGDIPAFRVYENDDTIAFMDINPLHPGHVLVIPKEHSANVYEVSDEAIAVAARTARRVARAVNAVVEPDGLNVLQCNGPAAGQSVFHFHMHVLPRRPDDGAALNWEVIPGNMEEIGALAEKIRARIES